MNKYGRMLWRDRGVRAGMNTLETTRKVIDSIKSRNLKVIFDPADILSPQWAEKQDDLYKRAMDSWEV